MNRPGNYELPLGAVTFRELIDELGGGIRDGRKIKAFIPGGSSAPILTGDKRSTPRWTTTRSAAAGSMLGSAR